MTISPELPLNDGHRIPHIGFGTYPLSDDEATVAVEQAIAVGYRLIDTASGYHNEAGVGRAIRSCGLPRGELFVTTKLRGADHGYDAALRGFDGSAKRLGLDYVDLYLIHWPLPRKDLYVDTWRALSRLREERRVRSIGVSNFAPRHIDRLIAETGVAPAVNQIELHLDFAQKDVRAYNASKRIVTEAWSPLGKGGELLRDDVVAALAKKYGKTAAQIALRWHVDIGTVPIPKSRRQSRMRENIEIFDFSLTADDLSALGALERGHRLGGDPETGGEE
jgi:2,5-diketo-D-gluconate reductase A